MKYETSEIPPFITIPYRISQKLAVFCNLSYLCNVKLMEQRKQTDACNNFAESRQKKTIGKMNKEITSFIVFELSGKLINSQTYQLTNLKKYEK